MEVRLSCEGHDDALVVVDAACSVGAFKARALQLMGWDDSDKWEFLLRDGRALGDDAAPLLLDDGEVSLRASRAFVAKECLRRKGVPAPASPQDTAALDEALAAGDGVSARLLLDTEWYARPALIKVAIRCAREDDAGALRLLLEGGFGADERLSPWDKTALMVAAEQGAGAACAALLEHGAAVNAVTARGWGALHLALYSRRIGVDAVCTDVLIPNGADVHAGPPGVTPLTLAAKLGSERVVRALLAGGADVNASGRQGMTPLMLRIQMRAMCPRAHAARGAGDELCEVLLDGGAEVDAVAINGKSALSIAAGSGQAGVCEALAARGADVNLCPEQATMSALSAAAQGGHADVCRVLLDHGADPNHESPNNAWSPLMYAAQGDSAETCRVLLGAGARVDHRSDPALKTALMYAAVSGAAAACAVLLEAGASRDLCSPCGATALDMAQSPFHWEEACEVLRGAACKRNHLDGLSPRGAH